MSDESDEKAADPFADLDEAVGDRDGDPFDRIERSHPAETGATEGTGEKEQFPGVPEDDEPSPDPTGESDVSAPPEDSGVRTPRNETDSGAISGRIEDPVPGEPSFPEGAGREGDPFDRFEDVFDENEVERIDPDTVWEELESAQTGGSVTEKRQRIYAEVSKHSYCEQCEYFSAPPVIRCGHEGTQIVEFLDMETVRVVDCPVVAERKELREGGHGKD